MEIVRRELALLLLAALGLGEGCSFAIAGIDLGTTSSAIAVVGADEQPCVLRDASGRSSVPSLVRFEEPDGRALVGHAAGDEATVRSFKRLIGRSHAEARKALGERSPLLHALEPLDDGSAALRCVSSERVCSPIEASTAVLKELLARAAGGGESPQRAVIAVPAHFSRAQRQATEEAALAAGVAKVRLLEEPVAVALAYGASGDEDELVCVFDLGGGTLDVALLETGGGTIEVSGRLGDGDALRARIAHEHGGAQGRPRVTLQLMPLERHPMARPPLWATRRWI